MKHYGASPASNMRTMSSLYRGSVQNRDNPDLVIGTTLTFMFNGISYFTIVPSRTCSRMFELDVKIIAHSLGLLYIVFPR